MLNKVAAAARRLRHMISLYSDPAMGGAYTLDEAKDINDQGGLLVGQSENETMGRVKLTEPDLERAWKQARGETV